MNIHLLIFYCKTVFMLWSPDLYTCIFFLPCIFGLFCTTTNLLCTKPVSDSVKSSFQFCDFVSVSWLVNLVGRVVTILLDYVGQVSLCCKLTKILQKHKEWPHIQRTTCELTLWYTPSLPALMAEHKLLFSVCR